VERDVGEVHIESVSVEEAWTRLKGDAGSVLIDVRTIAEWAYVGLPDLSAISKRPVLVEWQGFPDDRLNTAFVERITEAALHLSLGPAQLEGSPGNGGSGLRALPQCGGRVRRATRPQSSQRPARRLEGQRAALGAGVIPGANSRKFV
jgi:rhodanese-related sulfurtransferase